MKKNNSTIRFVKISAFLSNILGYIIISLTTLIFYSSFIQKPSSDVMVLGLSAFGFISVLSALCFSMAQCINDDKDKQAPLYAGEKFLHSAILLMQTLIIKYAGESIISIDKIKELIWIHSILFWIFHILLAFIGGLALWFSIYGYNAINEYLWSRYETRVKSLIK